MSTTVIDHTSFQTCLLSTKFRRTQPGPESELVDVFLSNLELNVPRDCRLTIFREPRLASGYPDVVLVIWHVPTVREWEFDRLSLRTRDFCVMQHLLEIGLTPEERIANAFGSYAKPALRRLEVAGMVIRTKDKWKTKPLNTIYAVRSIIAIEAKMTRNQAAIRQASINTWFASSSYILLPYPSNACEFNASAKLHGVEVLTRELCRNPFRFPTKNGPPISYASWLFNEWAWKASIPQPSPNCHGIAI